MDSKPPPPRPERTRYVCGGCGEESTLSQAEAVKCPLCPHRLLYKKRTTRIIEHIAR